MNTTHQQIAVLRRLAKQYIDVANQERYLHNAKLHHAVNDKAMIRPVVLVEELPWHEMNIDGMLTPVCEEGPLRAAEIHMRRILFRHKFFPADMVVQPYIPVQKVIKDSGIGITVDEKVIAQTDGNHIVAHEYHDQLEEEASLDKLHPAVIEYDKEQTLRNWQMVGDAIGDILPVRLCGVGSLYTAVWDNISFFRGVTPLLIDLIERPEYTHRMVKLLTYFEQERLRQYEEQGLLDAEQYSLHCTASFVSDLPGTDYDGEKVTRKQIWGRGMAQILASVSKSMRDEFDIDYMLTTIGTCGLSYYGCCEPLDNMVDILSKLPNLRKIGVTPWANKAALCEQIGKDYVVSSKPNPASVAVPMLDKNNLRAELTEILTACKNNGCSCDIVLKDISTCLHRPENIFEWEQVAMEMARSF